MSSIIRFVQRYPVFKFLSIQILDSLLNEDVLKVRYHGSSTSSIMSMVKHVSPKYAIISVGQNNRYGHPSEKIVQRWVDSDAIVFRTDKNGAVIVSLPIWISYID